MWAIAAGWVLKHPMTAKLVGVFLLALLLVAPMGSCAWAEYKLKGANAQLVRAQQSVSVLKGAAESNAASAVMLGNGLRQCVGQRQILREQLRQALEKVREANRQMQADIDEGERTRIVLVETSPAARDWLQTGIPDEVTARWLGR